MKFEVEKDSKAQNLYLGDIVKLPQDIKTGNAFFGAGYYMVVLTGKMHNYYHEYWYTLLNLESYCVQTSLKCSETSLIYNWIKENTCNEEIKIYSGGKSKMILKEINTNE